MDYREFIQLDLPVAVAIVSCGADWRVEEANAEFTDVLGYTEKELRETRPQKMVYDEDYANLVSVLENVVRTHDNGKMQLRIVRPDGKIRWVEMRCSVLAHYDVKPYVVLFLWDIDEEKRREEHQKLLNQKYELMEQLSLEYPFDLDVENWTMLRSYRLMELRGQVRLFRTIIFRWSEGSSDTLSTGSGAFSEGYERSCHRGKNRKYGYKV